LSPKFYVRRISSANENPTNPFFSPDGRELFYRNSEEVIAVPIDTKSTFNAEKPRVLFREPYITWAWDISPDGKRFLMMKQHGALTARGPRRINIVLNWFEELKQRVPVK
jgi:hypothetical protein